MIAVKENKLVIAERLLELGVNVNDRAKVSLYFKDRDEMLYHIYQNYFYARSAENLCK